MRNLEEVRNYFIYHPPTEEQRFLYERVNAWFINMAEMIWEEIPPFNQSSPDKTVALRRLSDARMGVNMTIACYVPPQGVKEETGLES